MYRYFKTIDNSNHTSAWKSKKLSDQSIKLSTISDNSFTPSLNYFGVRTRVKFDDECLRRDKVTFRHK